MAVHSPTVPNLSLLLNMLFLKAPLSQGCKYFPGQGGIAMQLPAHNEFWMLLEELPL